MSRKEKLKEFLKQKKTEEYPEKIEFEKEPEKEEKKVIELNPLSDNGLFRNELLLRLDLHNQGLHKIAEILEKFEKSLNE